MIHIKAFLIGIFIICIGIYFGDPVQQEFSIVLDNAIRLTGNVNCPDTETGWKVYCDRIVPR